MYLKQKKYRESPENFYADFKQKVAGIKCHENSKIQMSGEFKITNCWKERKIGLKMQLVEQVLQSVVTRTLENTVN